MALEFEDSSPYLILCRSAIVGDFWLLAGRPVVAGVMEMSGHNVAVERSEKSAALQPCAWAKTRLAGEGEGARTMQPRSWQEQPTVAVG